MKSWLFVFETALLVMVGLRIISGLIELTAAGLMLKLNSVEKAVAINAMLAIVGPVIFLSSITIGLLSMADRMSPTRLLFIGTGVCLILIGIRK
ncbi:YqhV family protein [Halalkalibacterium halodurans]|uniref:BH2798 protein n=2 Tax=Halalkalibacterium halodurans TaxID=86665 RepID=Q9K952_HALH5|nr:YqhV family protein [Halalkalibacterium halodurans]MDY7223351.1 YqhV family protein [Halalkalibacterium halodurans]MDY7242572.1 YqhV family protein [Halalkalibacterium halodurans]MED3646885.1 YqhV family protein [Halalkalibacterium halodurans]MED4080214.1 YqhV family protein [Halalkalibacterium halodurans]MED4084718.1 YqhV family protein [Halalkalibacterium halodurans]